MTTELAHYPDWLRTRDKSFTFGGMPIQQVPSALPWLERLMVQYKVASVLELGTGWGATTCLFGLLCPDRVTTCALKDQRGAKAQLLHAKLGIEFVAADLYLAETVEFLWEIAASKQGDDPMMLFCDGGDKHKDFLLYAPHTRPGDLIVCHDTYREFYPERRGAPDVADANHLERVFQSALDADNSWLCAYVRQGGAV
jgi:predicted O-methyltransferase YrrM